MRVWPALLMLVVFPSLAEQWMVLESSAPQLRQGKMLDGSRDLIIAAGDTVTLVSRSGRERVVRGPFDDRPDSLLAEGAAVDQDRDTVPVVGATRDIGGSGSDAPDPSPGR